MRLMEETWGSRGVEWGDGVQTQGRILNPYPNILSLLSLGPHIIPRAGSSLPKLSSLLSHDPTFQKRAPRPSLPSLGWPHCQVRGGLLPRWPVCQPCREGRALTLGVLSCVQSPSAQSWCWISQAKRAGHSPFSWAIRATTGGVARRGLLPPIPLGSKTPVR